MRTLRHGLLLVASVLALGVAQSAAAQWGEPMPGGQPAPVGTAPATGATTTAPATTEEGPRLFAYVDIPFWLGSGDDDGSTDVFVLGPTLGGRYAILPMIEAGLAWGFSYASVSGDGTDESFGGLRGGNPYLFGHYVMRTPEMTLRVGGGLTLPLSGAPEGGDGFDEDLDAIAAALGQAYAGALYGLWNPWIWAFDRFTLVLPSASVELTGMQMLLLRAEAAMGIAFYTGDAEDVDTELVAQLAVEGGVRTDMIEAGLRLQMVVLVTGDETDGVFIDDDDDFQSAAEAFVKVRFHPAFVRGSMLLNLDHPAGFAFDTRRVWGLHIGGGVEM